MFRHTSHLLLNFFAYEKHRGGGRERNTETGAMVRTKDATESATNYRAFLNAHQKRTLVAVIAGKVFG